MSGNTRRWRLISCVSVAVASAAALATGVALSASDAALSPTWILDGMLLGLLLRCEQRTRRGIMAAAFLGATAGWIVLGHNFGTSLAFAGASILFASVATALFDAVLWHPDHLTTPRGLAIAVPVVLAVSPLVPAALLIMNFHVTVDDLFDNPPWRGVLMEAPGLAVITPLTLNLVRRDMLLLLVPPLLAPTLVLAGLYAAIAAAVSLQQIGPMLFLLCPCLLFLVGRLGPAGAGLGILLTFLAGAASLLLERGTLVAAIGPGPGSAILFFQIMLIVLSAMVYALGAAVAERRQMNQALADQHARLSRKESLYRLLTDHASDVITRVHLDGRRLYVSPACTAMLGWSQAEMMDPNWQTRVHPDDLPGFSAVRTRMAAGEEYASNIYRYARKDGTWCWLETRMHMVRRADGSAKEFVANMRDITRQKETELALARAMAELAEKAATDGLTGVANRGRFDETLDQEWHRAMRSGETVALLLIDADHFKSYNDRYGHQAGDACLKAIARTVAEQIRRPHDLVARYGGEEFVVILPATSLDGGLDVAERIRAAVEGLDIPHEANADGVATVSIGVATAIPTPDIAPAGLVEAADAALYSAKRDGRNRVQASISPIRSAVVVPLLPHFRRAALTSQADRAV